MWLDEFQQVVFAHSLGFPYRWPTVRGVLWHTTEGWSAENAFSVFASFPSCPHITAEWERGTDRVVTQRRFQHVPTEVAAYAVQHGDADHPCVVETNASGIVQIELVGFAAESGSWPIERLKWIGEKILAPILAAHPSIPPWVYPLDAPRMTETEWAAWPGGQCRHSDVCCQPQQHGDPGGLDLDLVLHYALAFLDPKEVQMVLITPENDVANGVFLYDGPTLRHVKRGEELALLRRKKIDEWTDVTEVEMRAIIESAGKVGTAPGSGKYAGSW